MRPLELLASTLQDARFAARMLRRSPGFTAVAVLTLGLGIGAGTAVFSVVESVLLRQPPLAAPDRLVMVWLDDHQHGFPRDEMSYPRFDDTRRLAASLSGAAAFERQSFVLTGGGDEPEQLRGLAASASLFSVLGVRAALGRTFVAGEDVPGNDRVVVLAHGLWVRRFGADPAIVGRRLQINSQPCVVIGVMPASFYFPDRQQELWMPLAPDAERRAQRNAIWLSVVARLRPAVALGQATAELDALNRRLGEQYPNTDQRAGTVLVRLRDQAAEPLRRGLLVLAAAVVLVLLVACANVAGLQLARAAGREREMAARLALGAGPGRLVRQLLAESLALSALGGALGLLLAAWGVRGLPALAPAELEPLASVHLDLGAALFALAAGAAAGIAAGVYPALRLLRHDRLSGLGQRTAGAAAGSQRLRQALVAAQLALAVLLLTGSGLLIHGLLRLEGMDTGFRPDHLLAVRVSLPAARYAHGAARQQFFDRLEQRLGADPRVRAVGAIESLLLGALPNASGSFTIAGRPADTAYVAEPLTRDAITPGAPRVLGLPLLQGRAFTAADGAAAPPVVIVDAAMARRFWPAGNAVGQRIAYGRRDDPSSPWLTIVGVVADSRRAEPGSRAWLESFQPEAQYPRRSLMVMVRTGGDPLALAAAVRREIHRLDPDQPVAWISTVERLLADRLAPQRFDAALLGLFAAAALLMAAVGLYGVMSYLVTLRTQEIGVRMAIGARRADVLRLIAGRAAALAAAGAAAGTLAALALARWIASLLYGVGPLDPVAFTLAPLLLAAAATAAAWLPAWRASRVDPMSALRRE
ncbi:MAG TPA: ADOP family duplicated permease [Thermoanaerobaculia bacterium]|nr:ADOP family duplicated permease [Thermoanaerobaculia bacterium]